MKGVILSICPTARLIDLTHAIQPQNVRQAAYVLLSAYSYMPPQTIFVAVIDPGVGTSRKPIAVQTNHGIFVGPDNGLFGYIVKHVEVRKVVALQNPKYMLPAVSATFHGRDIFSPMAAHLAQGVAIDQLGSALHRLEMLSLPRFEATSEAIHGEILYIDHFGNLITSIGRLTWNADDMLSLVPFFDPQLQTDIPLPKAIRPESCAVQLANRIIEPIYLTYSAVPKNEVLALINSAGQLEIAVNQGNAAQALNAHVGQPVTLHLNHEDYS
jgi:hypothetical protein